MGRGGGEVGRVEVGERLRGRWERGGEKVGRGDARGIGREKERRRSEKKVGGTKA